MSATGQQTRLRFLLGTPLMYGASESGVEFDANLPRYIRITDIRPDGTLDPDKAVSLPRDAAQPYLLNDRDVLLARSGATVGKAFLYRSNGGEACFAGYLIRARCDRRRLLPEYFAYYLQSAGYWDFINRSALQATIQNVSAELYKEISITHPSVEEQKKVVAYLDGATGKVDRLVSLRRRQMEMLREQRAALIQQAVTRGLNPDVLLKDSGLPWLGQIPSHWQVKRLGSIATIKARLGWKGLKAEEYVSEGYIFLSTPNLKGEEIDFENVNYITKTRYDESPEISIREGDVLVAKDGATLGITALVKSLPAPATVNGSIAVLRPYRECSGDFLALWFRSHGIQQLIDLMKGGMGVPHLFQSDLRRFPVVIPPENEQLQLLTFVEKETSKLDRLLSAYTRQIELLTEYRAALIHECVTGRRAVPVSPSDETP